MSIGFVEKAISVRLDEIWGMVRGRVRVLIGEVYQMGYEFEQC